MIANQMSSLMIRPHENAYRKRYAMNIVFELPDVMWEKATYELLLETPNGMDILIRDYDQNHREI